MARSHRPGSRVTVDAGRWRGRVGTFVGYHTNPGGGIQQSQWYPIVDLDASGKAGARRVRVLSVTPIEREAGYGSVQL